jgi:hypothetical protein
MLIIGNLMMAALSWWYHTKCNVFWDMKHPSACGRCFHTNRRLKDYTNVIYSV